MTSVLHDLAGQRRYEEGWRVRGEAWWRGGGGGGGGEGDGE